MPERAHVKSTEAIEWFRAALLVYLSKARPVLEDIFDEISRLRDWIDRDRRRHWEAEVRRRRKALEDAQQALFGAGLMNLRSPTTAEKSAVSAARRALAEAETKLKMVKKWARDLDARVQPLLKELEHLRTVYVREAPEAANYLAQLVKRLDEYESVRAPGVSAAPRASPTGDTLDEAEDS